MDILHVLPYAGLGGTEIATLRVIQAVKPFGIHGQALLLAPFEPLANLLRSAGVPVTNAPLVPEPSIRSGLRFLAQSRALASAIRNLRVDAVHCADILAAYHTSLAGRLARVPVLCHVRNRWTERDLSKRDQLFLRLVTKFVFVSRSTWDIFALPVSQSHGAIVYDGIDVTEVAPVDIRKEYGLPGESIVVGMFARLAPQKDYATLVEAARLIAPEYPAVRFVIVGRKDGVNQAHYDNVRTLVENAGVTEQFVFTGFRADAQAVMAGIDIFVLSTHWEGLPLVVLEAMSRKKPVIATAVDGIPEVISHGKNGLLYPHADAPALAACLRQLLNDREEASRLAAAGFETVENVLTPEQFAEGMRSVYTSTVRSKAQVREVITINSAPRIP